MKEWVKNTRNFAYKYMVLILLGISTLGFFLAYTTFDNNIGPKNFIVNISTAILSSGLFTAVIKAIQFNGIFREEIQKTMLGTEFLERRDDLTQLWSKLSRMIYKDKFPDISDDLECSILETYFPVSNKFYFQNCVITINIESISNDFVIKYTQTNCYEVIMDEKNTDTELTPESQIDTDEDGGVIINDLLEFRINDVVQKNIQQHESTKNDPKRSKYIIPLKGEKKYNICSKFQREYSLKNENYKLIRAQHITNGMTVDISYPDDISVSFFNLGLINKFNPYFETKGPRISRIHSKGLILPHQGFGLSFEKRMI